MVVFLVVLQGIRMMVMSGFDASPSTSDNNNGSPASPKGVKEQLEHYSSDGQGRNMRGNNKPQKPAVEQNLGHKDISDEGEEIPSTDPPQQKEDAADRDDDADGAKAENDADGDANDDGNAIEGGDENADEDANEGRDGDAEEDGATELKKDMGEGFNPIVIKKNGTGPTNVGYVKDFAHERNDPGYKHKEETPPDDSSAVAELVGEKSVLPCHDGTSNSIHQRCSDADTPLIAYNNQDFVRTWCGKEILPKSTLVMTDHCTDPVAHLFAAEVPPVSGDHMPPITIKSAMSKKLEDGDIEKVDCNIPCQQEKGFEFATSNHARTDFFIDGETWKITLDMGYSRNVKLDRTDFMNEHYHMTQSLLSPVPMTTFDTKMHSLRNRPAVDFNSAKEKAIYLVDTDCSPQSTKRNRWFEAVAEKIGVDSYGHCGHNTDVPEGMTITIPENRIELSKQYRIVLAFDNQNSKDHISDVVWEAFVSGAVPVVLGADNIRDRFPRNSFINVADFKKWHELGDYVEKVVSDKELWESYHKWREDDAAITAFEKQYAFKRTGPTCRLCRWAYAKKYGMGWDHDMQEVKAVAKVPKDKFCATADHGLVSKPFVEQWVTKKNDGGKKVLKEDSEGQSCSSLETDGDIANGVFKGHRNVVQHDGVTDFIITEAVHEGEVGAATTLRLQFPGVRNPDGACFYNTHTSVSTVKGSKISSASIQDDQVKITVLANWDTRVTSPGEGIMEVSISETESESSVPRKVRVIIEEMHSVLDKMTEFFPSSYCKLMTKDFIDPISVFFAT